MIRKISENRIFNIKAFLPVFFTLLSIIYGCNQKEEKTESPDFTKADLGFTGNSPEETIEHIRFEDVTLEAGINFHHVTGAFGEKWMPETLGSGGGFLDFNMDGWPDIFLVNSSEWPGHETGIEAFPKLYQNNGDGTFEDISLQAGLDFTCYGMGSSFADFDADGDIDIYITTVNDNILLRNDNGKLTDITSQANVSGNDPDRKHLPAWSTSSAWVDVDRDGWLDLVVANYVKWSPETDIYTTRDGKTKSYATPDVYEGESCRLYRNINGKYFEDITEKSGFFNEEGKSLGVAIADFNRDNWPDIVIVNDTQPNFLYINNGDGTFNNMAVIAGIGFDENGRARAGMGVDIADFRNDGNLAIAIGNFSQEPLSLYTQIGNGDLFQDLAGPTRLTRPTLLRLTFGLQFVDLDLDGYRDLVAANGHIEPEINAVQKDVTFRQPPQIFYNNKGSFIDISKSAGDPFNIPIVARGIASADYDRDGDFDLLFTANGDRPRLLRNDITSNSNYLKVRLKGSMPNWQAIGAKIILWTGGIRQQQMVKTGSSYLSQSDLSTAIFGLGDQVQADSLMVTWPASGEKDIYRDLQAGQLYIIEEGSGLMADRGNADTRKTIEETK